VISWSIRTQPYLRRSVAQDFYTDVAIRQHALDDEQRARLLEIPGRCPVHRTLDRGVRIAKKARP
jgi:uncharacterized OsmC-like protein